MKIRKLILISLLSLLFFGCCYHSSEFCVWDDHAADFRKMLDDNNYELDAILQNINDINKNLCWKIDPKYSFFKVERKYKIYLGNIKSRIDLVEKCISGEYAGATISY